MKPGVGVEHFGLLIPAAKRFEKGFVAQILGGALLAIPGVQGTDAGKALEKVTGLLGGSKPAPTGGTNAPATNKPAPFNPLDLLNKPKKK